MNTFTLLALYPDIQEKLFQEIQSVFPSQNDDITKEDVNNMPYLDAFLKEAFRFFPVVPFVTRIIKKDFRIGSYSKNKKKTFWNDFTAVIRFLIAASDDVVIPKGSEVLMDICAMHRNKNNWKFDATKFNPENFFPENAVPRSAYAYIPFSAGPRVCIGEEPQLIVLCEIIFSNNSIQRFIFAGKKYGVVAMKLFIIYVVRQYRLLTKLKLDDLKFQMQITLAMLNKNVIEIENRDEY